MDTPILAGWAAAEITPDIPCRMGGYGARIGLANAIHDPLYAHVLALGTPEQPFVVIICDLIAVDETLVDEVRQHMAAQHPHAAVWLGATHTHSGPDIARSLSFSPEPLDPAPRQRIIAKAGKVAVVLLGYTNGYAGYLPSREAYEELDYEVLMSPFASGSGERLVEAAEKMLA